MLTSGIENLDSILKSGHNGSHRHGLGFVASASRLKATSEIKFVPASMGVEHETIHTETGIRTTAKSLRKTCYYCGRKDNAWYFVSGCSRHMTGNISYFTNLKDCVIGHVTFGDGAKGKIIAKGNIDNNNLPCLNDVRSSESNANRKSGRKEICAGNTAKNEMLSQNKESFSAIKQINDEEDETPNMSEARTMSIVEVSKVVNPSDDSGKSLKKSSEESITKKSELIPSAHVKKNHPVSSIIGDPSAGMHTRRKEKIDYMKMVADLCYISTFEPSTVDSALWDEYWLNAMQEELLQFRRNNV
ncbi:putative mitochondrial protein [Cucumis melo var. makuwa]|uniref:Mitochondrial protein n=2 Tax=Cucumis melo var. makuwa TaxID=1194695 RepID=A0A5A7TBX1_CUCMM|nr:putative mitochondrial protein [Cucumis melo var. makuwa]